MVERTALVINGEIYDWFIFDFSMRMVVDKLKEDFGYYRFEVLVKGHRIPWESYEEILERQTATSFSLF